MRVATVLSAGRACKHEEQGVEVERDPLSGGGLGRLAWSERRPCAVTSDHIRGALVAHFWFAGVKESDTGLANPSQWDLAADKQMMQEEHALQVGCR